MQPSETGADAARGDWHAAQYTMFERERTRPVRDLLSAVPDDPRRAPRKVIDIGCGPGNSTELLASKASDATVLGLDSAPDMIDAARKRLPTLRFELADLADTQAWGAHGPFDLILANAVLQWLPDHPTLFPRLLRNLAPGGYLAVQMPDNLDEPAHRLLHATAARGPWVDALSAVAPREQHDASWYYDLLAPHCAQVDVWRTTYHHVLAGGTDAVLEWFRGSAVRPFVAALQEPQRSEFVAQYRAALATGYPPRADGSVLLPFPRLFMVAQRSP